MSEGKHTPEPWTAAPSDYQQRLQSAIDALPSTGGVVGGSAPSEDVAGLVWDLEIASRSDVASFPDLMRRAALALSQRAAPPEQEATR